MIDMTVGIGIIGIDLVTGYPLIEWMGWFYIMQKAWIKLALVQQINNAYYFVKISSIVLYSQHVACM